MTTLAEKEVFISNHQRGEEEYRQGIIISLLPRGSVSDIPRRSGIEKGLKDIRIGNIFHAKDSADLLSQILD